jgi:hypothetical protein
MDSLEYYTSETVPALLATNGEQGRECCGLRLTRRCGPQSDFACFNREVAAIWVLELLLAPYDCPFSPLPAHIVVPYYWWPAAVLSGGW